MSRAQAHAAVLDRTASRFEDVNHSLDTMLRRLMTELDVLQQHWRGSGGRTFDQVRRAWAEDQTRLHRALAETATAIRTSGRDYAASDSDAATRVKAASRSLILPL